ncbi:AAA family ATPase [Streptomyces sp. B21-102]|uniref:helix-turn-helix transcriptional regulator n=1 Tax=Streptomyces sp. B21-102 TaxID=3039416 RepID=UPI002FF3AEB1
MPEAAPVPGAAARLGGPVFLRDAELGLLRGWLTLSGQSPQVVRVSGEPGVGKSHLLRRLVRSARRDGWTVAAGRIPRGGGTRPLEVVVDALDDVLARADGSLFEQLGAAATGRLAAVFPSLHGPQAADGTAHAMTGGMADGAAGHYGLLRALRAAVAQLASGRGLLLVLDDAHRACALTTDFIEYLVRCPPRAPVLTVFAHRAVPADRHLTALAYEAPNLHHLRLAPLSDDRMRALLPAGPGPVAVAVALRDAGGVPGLLGGAGAGGPSCGTGGGAGAGGAGGGVYGVLEVATGVPPSAAAARGLDLHCLSSLGWRTACAAAVVGDSFLPSVVAATAQLPESDVLCALDALHAESLVVPDAHGRRFRFVRPAVRARIHHASGAGWRHAARLRAVAALRAAGETLALAAHLVDCDALTADDAGVLAEAARETLWRQPARAARALARAGAVLGDPVEPALWRAEALVLAGQPGAAERLYAATWHRLPAAADATAADAVLWRVRGLRGLGRYAQAGALLDAPPRGMEAGDGGRRVRAERLALAVEMAQLGVSAGAGTVERAVRAVSEDVEAGPGLAVTALLGAAHALGGATAAARDAADRVDRALGAGAAGADAGAGPAGGTPGGAAEGAHWVDRLEACRWLGETELRLGMPGRAAPRFERGLRAALFLGHGHAIAPLALGLARTRREYGDQDAAQFPGELAAAVSAGHGNSWMLSFANGIAEEKKGRSSGRPANSPLAAASARETEIAHLVSAGYTNQRIAAHLGISTKTVETHMSRIFKKLGVNSRAEVAHAVGRSGTGPGAP